ncbi:MAG TPA: peptidase S8, partial [Umezawaea sp.]|nr:peptidase S8 [Umezawaea sp.]
MARRAVALVLASALAAAAAPAHAAPGGTAPGTTSTAVGNARGQVPPGDRKTVTLVTGDKVVLDGDRLVSVTPGAHRENVSFQVTRHAGRVRVVPSDVARTLAEGRVDRRLFDVTGLVEAGYDDARRDTVPVIVSGGHPPSGALVAEALPTVDAVAAEVPKATGWRDLPEGTGKVWLDGVARPLLD